MAKKNKKVTKKAKARKVAAPKVELVETFATILLGLKNNRAQELEMLFNAGYTIKSEVASRAGVYVTFSKMVPVVDVCDDCLVAHQ